MSGLSARSREMLRLRFEQGLTQAEIGERLGVSQMQISRLIRQALTQMRAAANDTNTIKRPHAGSVRRRNVR